MKLNFNIPQTKSLEINTILNLLLKPGYLIKDYLAGKREGILPPVTAVLLFFSFYVLISDAFSYHGNNRYEEEEQDTVQIGPVTFTKSSDSIVAPDDESISEDSISTYTKEENLITETGLFRFIDKVYTWFTLYEHPEIIDSQFKQVLATAETWIRGQGVFSFITDFLLFFPALCLLLRKVYTIKENAVVTAYILCQRCMFKVFAVIVTLGKSNSIGLLIGTLLLAIVFSQLLGIGWKQGIKKAILYWMLYLVVMAAILVPLIAVAVLTIGL